MSDKRLKAIILALLAAALYALNVPASKMLLASVGSTYMAAFLYLGAGAGISVVFLFSKAKQKEQSDALDRSDLPYVLGMILLDIAAPICLMLGLSSTSASGASLLGNFEIVATSLIALFVFRESISKRLWTAIVHITIASAMLSYNGGDELKFSAGSLLILVACVCWGFENNCTRRLSSKNTYQIVMLKGFFSGAGSLIIALIVGEKFPQLIYILYIMALGFVAYGLSIFCYVRAQKELGAAKTGAYYAIAPFIGAFLSLIFLHEQLSLLYGLSLLVMLVGAMLVVMDTLNLRPLAKKHKKVTK
ncbi:MAG: DMT family transporter [Eubacteriales bacterium]|nr:DMT family transporter [Eubacteriales bacterium]